MRCRQQRNRLLSVLPVRIQTVFVRGGPTITAFFLCLFLNDDERLEPDITISGPSSVCQQNVIWMAFRWRAYVAGPSLNARMITVIFQGIRIRIAGGGGGVWIRDVLWRPSIFYCCSHCIRGLPNYVVLSRRKRTFRRKKSVADNIYMSGVALCCVHEQDTCILVLVLVQPRKTRPDISEKLLTGR